MPARKIRPVNWYSIFLPHIFLLLAVGFELPNQYQLIFADELISYAAGDSAIADELRNDLEKKGLKCFMAEKDIQVATEWQDSIRAALIGSKRVLVLLTPRSLNRPWVLMETGAAWALGKALIPALSHVSANELLDPIRRHQARVIETTAQRQSLVNELTGT
jgi:hypothetical protein